MDSLPAKPADSVGRNRGRHRRRGQCPANGDRRSVFRRPNRAARTTAPGCPPGAGHLSPRPARRREHEGGRQVLRDYRQLLDLYKVEKIRAVATTAVREASNGETFLDRVFMATKLNVEVIDTSEESRLTVSAVRQAVGDALGVNQRQTLIADVGGGSTLLTVLGKRRNRHLAEPAAGFDPASGNVLHQRGIAEAVGQPVAAAYFQFPLDARKRRAAGRDRLVRGRRRRCAVRRAEVGTAFDSSELAVIDVADFDKLVDRCERYTAEELSKRHGLPFAEAETLNPALLVYQLLLHKTKAPQVIVSHISMRDGLLLELAHEVTGKEDTALLVGVIHSATAIAEKYHVDMEHARNVAAVSVRLFDLLQPDHGLGPRQRLLLRVAGLLHEVGGFVSSRAHHKHSEYLIANSEIFGLNRNETTIVSQIARYHRRSVPPPPTRRTWR